MRTKELTPKQETFVSEYILLDGNGSQAAINAGYAPNSAKVTASRLLTKTNVSKAIERKRNLLAVKTEYSIATWRADLLADIADAKAAGSHSAVLKGRELLGRHIGALTNERTLSPEEGKYLSLLESAMAQALTSQAQSASLPSPETAIEVTGSIKPPRD